MTPHLVPLQHLTGKSHRFYSFPDGILESTTEEDARMRDTRGVQPKIIRVTCIHNSPVSQRNGENQFILSRTQSNLLN